MTDLIPGALALLCMTGGDKDICAVSTQTNYVQTQLPEFIAGEWDSKNNLVEISDKLVNEGNISAIIAHELTHKLRIHSNNYDCSVEEGYAFKAQRQQLLLVSVTFGSPDMSGANKYDWTTYISTLLFDSNTLAKNDCAHA